MSTEAIATLAAARGDVDPTRIAALTGGNPFFVTQVLETSDQVPPSVAAAVLGRRSRLPQGTREVLGLRATEPTELEPPLLEDLLPTQRLRDHRTVLDALLAHHPDQAARILHHAASAGGSEVIAEPASAAAQEAFAAGAHRQAVTYEELALRHEDRLESGTRVATWEQHVWSLPYLRRPHLAAEAASMGL